jgi:cation-transporting P-type ATPase E
VIRDGTQRDIAVADLVAGDPVDLRAGDQLVADGVVRASMSMAADESLLTGESEPVVTLRTVAAILANLRYPVPARGDS